MSEHEENFEDVKRLLRCKRYEQPPPGYFASFSDKVVARIEAQAGAEYSSWWSWFIDRFDAKPVLVCAYGLAVSGLLLTGFHLSQVFEAEAATASSVNGWLVTTPISPALLSLTGSDAEFVATALRPSANLPLVFQDEATHLRLAPPGSHLGLQPVGFTRGNW